MSELKLKVDELLSKLEKKASAEEIFAQNLVNDSVQEKVHHSNENSVDFSDMEKVAMEWDHKGRILARAFFDELQKLAAYYEAGVEGVAPVNEESAVNILTKLYNNVIK